MIVTYSPQGGTKQTWNYKQAELTSAEAELLEEATGYSIEEFDLELMKGRTKCRRALLWLRLRKEHKNLKFDEVEFKVGELTVEFDREEKGVLRKAVEESDLPLTQKEQVLKLLADDEDEEPQKTPKKGRGES